jgi:hypothetical protein
MFAANHDGLGIVIIGPADVTPQIVICIPDSRCYKFRVDLTDPYWIFIISAAIFLNTCYARLN